MNPPRHDLGPVASIDAEAIGRPGQRRFRLTISSRRGVASVWLEKEQLIALAQALDELLGQGQHALDAEDTEPLPVPAAFDVDFRAVRLGLGYEETNDLFALHAYDTGDSNLEPSLRCELNRRQSQRLSRRIETVVAGGRPLCPLCQEPMDPTGHACPKSNGHRDTKIVL
jgi:uncharacterized repeat protein (TIGR03847 family)